LFCFLPLLFPRQNASFSLLSSTIFTEITQGFHFDRSIIVISALLPLFLSLFFSTRFFRNIFHFLKSFFFFCVWKSTHLFEIDINTLLPSPTQVHYRLQLIYYNPNCPTSPLNSPQRVLFFAIKKKKFFSNFQIFFPNFFSPKPFPKICQISSPLHPSNHTQKALSSWKYNPLIAKNLPQKEKQKNKQQKIKKIKKTQKNNKKTHTH